MTRFETAEMLAKLAIGKAPRFDLFAENSESDSIEFRNNKLNSVNSKQAGGIGLRTFIDGQQGLASSNSVVAEGFFGLTPDELIERSIKSAAQGDAAGFALPGENYIAEDVVKADMKLLGSQIIDKGKEVIDKLLSSDPESKVGFFFTRVYRESLLLNSSSAHVTAARETFSISITNTITEEGNIQDIWDSVSMPQVCDLTMVDRALKNILFLSEHSRKGAEALTGKCDVIFTPKAMQSLLSMMLNPFKGSLIHKKSSYIADKIGKKIGDASLNISEDPFNQKAVSFSKMDHEGLPCTSKFFINKGVVESVVTSLHSAEKLGVKASGNGFRSYSSLPSDEATNIFLAPGNMTFEQLLASVKNGILVDQMIGAGQSNVLSGEFSVNLDLAFRIENGNLTGRIKNCMLADNVFGMLDRITGIGNEQISYGDVFLPYVKFSGLNLTVG